MELNLARGEFFGRVMRRRELAAVILTETAYPLGHDIPRHAHDHAYFCFVLRGSFTESDGRRSYLRRRATLIFHPRGESHSDHFQTEAHCFNVQLDARRYDRPARLNQPASFRGGPLALLATKLYREFRAPDEVSELAIEGLALEMTAEAARAVRSPGHPPAPWLGRARELLHAHFAGRLSVAEVAAAVGVHPAHLAREFRHHHRRTVGEYVRQLRVEFACRQIASTDTPLSQVAVEAGFFDQSHFARTFKLLTGLSPAAYRKDFRTRASRTKR
jgi:AraC family transcriptional regulator